jgi:hypothetical protein
MKLFQLAWCTAAAFKLEMVAGAEPLVGVAVEADKVTPYKTRKDVSNLRIKLKIE